METECVLFQMFTDSYLTLVLLFLELSFFANTVDPDQVASDEAT